ncbi:MAG: GntR family transcriptional regulator [Oscillospiraceae bacterium]|nr:GntR family transcriptional regulator [Oscillospiraceae bacterium]
MIVEINTQDAEPIYEQLRDRIVLGIASGELTPGEALPSVRRLASDLGINFHTVNKSYAALSAEGYLVIDRRRGAVVARPPSGTSDARSTRRLLLAAAEAICRGTDETAFLALCSACYQKASGRPSNQENGG